jgi:hypothetical protein
MSYKDPEKNRAYQRQYGREHPRRMTPEQNRRYYHTLICKRYGITPEIYQARFLAQGSCCAICGSVEPGNPHGWHLDHDHKTNSFRGILCHHCNVGLGMFRDDKGSMLKAIEYLNRTT